MHVKFPTVAVFKEAAFIPVRHFSSVFVSLGVFIVATVVAIILMALGLVISEFDFANVETLFQNMANGQIDGLGGILFSFLLFLLPLLAVTSHVFNYWVNLSAFGESAASWSFADGRFKAMVINALKLLFISILIGIVGVVVSLGLGSLGLVPSFADQLSNPDVVDQHLSGLTGNIITVLIYCGVYSLFSANLTYTALQSAAEGMEHPYVADFSIVLVMIYGMYIVSATIAALTGVTVLFWLVQLVMGLFVTFAVPAAHGVRYRFCTAKTAPTGDADTHADD